MEADKFLLKDRVAEINKRFIDNGWVKVFEMGEGDDEDQVLVYCCLVGVKKTQEYLENDRWKIELGSEGRPSIISTYKNGKEITRCHHDTDKEYEPFIFCQSFSNDEKYVDISEEFILYFKLYETLG